MADKLWLDLETYSEVDIKHGTYKYAENAEIMLTAWAVNDAEPECVDHTQGGVIDGVLLEALEDPSVEIWAHNSMFDRNVLRYHTGLELPIFRWRDTLVQAYTNALPGGLDKLCEIFKIDEDQAKLKDGRRLVHLFCKPRPMNLKLRRATHVTHPDEWQRFVEYAKQDISAMRAVHKKMPMYNYNLELANWHLDQAINDRGFTVDLALTESAVRAVAEEMVRLKAYTFETTEGALTSTSKRDKTLAYILEEFGISLEDLTKSTVNTAIDDERIPEGLKDLLRVRLLTTTTSTSKYKNLARAVNTDGKARGTIQFGGAQRTLRAAGRTFQPQNLPSRGLMGPAATEFGIQAMKDGTEQAWFPEQVMWLASSAIRGVLVAPPGKKLVVADLSNIEGRGVAALCGEEWKLQAFQDFDSGIGHDLYNLAYAKAFHVDVNTVTSKQRSIGKVMELMLGYGGGVGAFVTGALGYGFDLEKLAADTWDTLPVETVEESRGFLDWVYKKKMNRFGLSDEAFIACDVLKRLWRASNSAVASMWNDLESAATRAVRYPGEIFECRTLRFTRRNGYLYMRLPSGRLVCYPSPVLSTDGSLSYMGINQYTKKWTRLTTYGGKLLENATQAWARDVLYHGQHLAEAEGYQIVLHVHDELVTETPDSEAFTAPGLAKLMATNPKWAAGVPLAAAGFESKRYRK